MSRVRQFFQDLAAPLYPLDEAFIKGYLNEGEESYFRRLRRAEMLHSIRAAGRTASSLGQTMPEREKRAVIRAALLHDVGKYRYPLGPLGKTWMVLLGKGLARRGKRSPALDVYFNHPFYSADLLKRLGSFEDFPWLYQLVRWHHAPERFLSEEILSQHLGPKEAERRAELFQIFRQADEQS